MRVLLDECVDSRLAGYFGELTVATVVGQGWSGITNGKLLALAQQKFDVFVTVDRNLSFQQHLPRFDLAALMPRTIEQLSVAPKGAITSIGV
ncbi:MAG: hypothetical protein EPO25_10195 [Gammaproteobacteria bacterium]|nr:MAG: hypothetical protein EPO25_10195 [Gammaproteobacteria bacterium]